MLNSMPLFFAVRSIAVCSSSWMSGESSSIRPITRKRMSLVSSVFSSDRRYRFSSRMSVLTSDAGPLPVLDGERIQRQHAEAETRGGLDGVAHGIDARAMAFHARQVALGGPAAVAVHDDGDVRRQPLEVHLPGKRLVGMARPGSTPAAAQATRSISTSRGRKELIIDHPDEEQPVRRGRGARLRAAAARQQRRHRGGRTPAAADFDQRARRSRGPCGAESRRR